MNFIHHSRFNRQHKENTQILANYKKHLGRRDACKIMKEMQKEMQKLTTEQKDQLTEFHTNNLN